MNHSDVLRRAWRIVWQYKTLWLFGMILALTTVSTGSFWLTDGYYRPDDAVVFTYEISSKDQVWIERNFGMVLPTSCTVFRSGEVLSCEGHIRDFPEDWIAPLLTVVGGLLVLGLVIAAVVLIFRYVSEVALIRMVGDYEKNGEELSFRQGLRIGFSRVAVRLFFIDLIVFGLVLLVVALPFLPTLIPVPFMISGATPALILGGLAIGGFFFLGLAVVVVALAATALLVRFFRRACVLERLGVFASIGRGFRLVRAHVKDVGLIWLAMLAVDMVFPIVIIPAAILALGAGLVIGAGSGIIAGLLAQSVVSPFAAVMAGLVVGVPIFLFVVGLPMLLLDGMRQVFQSSTWTITYREIMQLQTSPIKSTGELVYEG